MRGGIYGRRGMGGRLKYGWLNLEKAMWKKSTGVERGRYTGAGGREGSSNSRGGAGEACHSEYAIPGKRNISHAKETEESCWLGSVRKETT